MCGGVYNMNTTIKELKKMFKDQYNDIEVYKSLSVGVHYPDHFFTDNCRYTEDWDDETIIKLYSLMDKEEYGGTLLANCCNSADDYFESEDDKILCCMISDEDDE